MTRSSRRIQEPRLHCGGGGTRAPRRSTRLRHPRTRRPPSGRRLADRNPRRRARQPRRPGASGNTTKQTRTRPSVRTTELSPAHREPVTPARKSTPGQLSRPTAHHTDATATTKYAKHTSATKHPRRRERSSVTRRPTSFPRLEALADCSAIHTVRVWGTAWPVSPGADGGRCPQRGPPLHRIHRSPANGLGRRFFREARE